MPSGRVKWFNNSKGYGFILADAQADGTANAVDVAGEDLFVHYSSVQMEGYRTLKAGEAVEFDLLRADRGFHAVNVRKAAVVDAQASVTTDGAAANGTGRDATAPDAAEPERRASQGTAVPAGT